MQYLTKVLLYTLSLFLFSGALLPASFAQKAENPHNFDYVYDSQIKSVKLHLNGIVLSYPIIDVNTSARLELNFDRLGEEDIDYIYTLTHCNADWKPSDLSDLEYIDGFNGERIRDFQYSFKTVIPYTHYRLLLPNNDIKWTKSGNYLLNIYEDTDKRKLVITRCFMVVEPVFQIATEVQRPAKVSKSKTHQEIDFSILHKGVQIQNPQLEVKVAVLQNGIWQRAITGLKPLFQREERLDYDFQDQVVFPAGKEFRHLDLRSFRYRSELIKSIEEYDDAYEVYLYTEQKRLFKNYSFINDINGKFIIENLDESRALDRQVAANLNIDFQNYDANHVIHTLESDYAYVYFSLDAPAQLDDDVYLYSSFTDWQMDDRYKMKYNDILHTYEAEVLLKQGFYNYLYVTNPAGGVDFEEIEGNWFETENEYNIFVYYRPFGERYDRLVAAKTFSSIFN